MISQRIYCCSAVYRCCTGEKVKHGGPQIVKIGPPVCLSSSAELLRSRIASGSQPGCVLIPGIAVFPRCAEIDQCDLAIRAKHDIGGFQIPVYDRRISAMQISQDITQLDRPVNDLLRRLGTLVLQQVLKTVPFNVIHDDDQGVLPVDHIDDSWKIRMPQFLEHLCFRNKSFGRK